MKKWALALSIITCVLLSTVSPSRATPLTGTFSITGTVTEGPTFFTFLCDIVPLMPCPAGDGAFSFAPGTGSFSSLITPGSGGYIKDLTTATTPVDQTFSLPDFLTPAPASDFALDLTFIHTGTGTPAECTATPPAPGQTCTPTFPALVTPSNPMGLAPWTFENTSSTSSTLTFALSGFARRISTGEITPFTGVFTEQFPNLSYQTELSQLATSGSITNSYSAFFNVGSSSVPEPATLALLSIGLAGLGFARRGMLR